MICLLALGDWILIIVHFFKYFERLNVSSQNDTSIEPSGWPGDENGSLLFFITVSTIGSYVLYFGIGGFLHVNTKKKNAYYD